jgi:hypothetical protein
VFFTLFFAGISAYVAIRRLTKTKYATVVSVFYVLYPFLLLNVNVRGGLSEAFGMALIPWVFLCLKEALDGSRKYGLLFVLFLSLTVLTHIFTTMLLFLSIALFIFSFDVGTRIKLRVFSYMPLSLMIVSFWLIPLLLELNFTSHTMESRINPIEMFIPKDWNCAGRCLMNGFYAGIVFFSAFILGLITTIASKAREKIDVAFAWVLLLLVVFLFGSDIIFRIPLISSLPQQNFRSLIVLGFVSCFFLVKLLESLPRVKIPGRFAKISSYLFIILLFLFVVDVYKMTGSRVNSNSEMIALFSLDGFQNLLDYSQNTYERVVMPDEIVPALSTSSEGSLFVSLEPNVISTYFGHVLQPQMSAAIFLDRSVAGPYPIESAAVNYFSWYTEASSSLVSLNSLRFAELMGYMGADTIVMTSGNHENACLYITNETENLFIYNNTCAEGRISAYNDAINDLGYDSFSREYVTFYGADSAEQEVNISVKTWEDDYVELEVEAGEESQGGYNGG